MRNVKFLSLLEKYTKHKVPSENTVRNTCVNSLYNAVINKIKSCIQNRFMWISINETTGAAERYVANVMIVIFDSDEQIARKKSLINTAHLEKANSTTIARLFDDSVKIL